MNPLVLADRAHHFWMAYVGNVIDRLLVTSKYSWKLIFYCIHLTAWLETQGSASRALGGVGRSVFGEVFRALHMLNLFNQSGKTITWLQRSLSHVPYPEWQVQSCTCLAQEYPSKLWESMFLGREPHWYLEKAGEMVNSAGPDWRQET